MRKPKDSDRSYDKIFKENLEEMVFALSNILMGLTWTKSEKIELKLQYTLEREPDFLRIVTTEKGEELILQVEFQGKDSRKAMLHRLVVYKGLLMKKYDLPVKQFVIYIGNEPCNFLTFYEDEDMRFQYHLINFKEIDKDLFLNSDRPEEVIFAILADFKGENPRDVIQEIAVRIKALEKEHLNVERYSKQLEMLSHLRNFDSEITKILRKMPITIDVEKSFFFKKGLEKGLEKGLKQGNLKAESKINETILELLNMGILNFEQIAQAVHKPIKYIKELKEKNDRELIQKMLKKGESELEQIAKELNLTVDFVKKIKTEFESKPKKNGSKKK